MFEKGRGNDHKELLVIYSADTIRLGSCYCCNNLRQKSTACCTFFVNIPLLSHRLCHIFALSSSFTVTHFHTQYLELYWIITNSLSDKLGGMFLNWDRRKAQNMTIFVLILCMHRLSWIYRSETFPAERNDGNINVKVFSHDLHFHVCFGLVFLGFFFGFFFSFPLFSTHNNFTLVVFL